MCVRSVFLEQLTGAQPAPQVDKWLFPSWSVTKPWPTFFLGQETRFSFFYLQPLLGFIFCCKTCWFCFSTTCDHLCLIFFLRYEKKCRRNTNHGMWHFEHPCILMCFCRCIRHPGASSTFTALRLPVCSLSRYVFLQMDMKGEPQQIST